VGFARRRGIVKRLAPIVILAMLMVALIAPPGAAQKVDLPEEPIALAGVTTFGAIEARTGEYAGDPGFLPGWDHFLDPAFNRCDVIEASLEMTGKHSAVLETWELCLSAAPMPPPRLTVWDVDISSGGQVKMEARYEYDYRPEFTGCAMNGTYPVYHGSFDGESFYAATQFHGICDGGLFWGDFGINEEIGPLHATFTVELDVILDG
jgi:hypothetical protein